jgi:hypothetical protein
MKVSLNDTYEPISRHLAHESGEMHDHDPDYLPIERQRRVFMALVDVRLGNAPVRVVRNHDRGLSLGSGALDWPVPWVLLTLITFCRRARYEGMAS